MTADTIAAGVVGLSQVQLDGDEIYWVEQRPSEGGRNVIVRRKATTLTLPPEGGVESRDVTPKEFNARTRVHEYGGGAYLASGGTVWFPTSRTSASTGRIPAVIRSRSRPPKTSAMPTWCSIPDAGG